MKLLLDVLAFVSLEALLDRAWRATKAAYRLMRLKLKGRKLKLDVEKEIRKIDAKDWLL